MVWPTLINVNFIVIWYRFVFMLFCYTFSYYIMNSFIYLSLFFLLNLSLSYFERLRCFCSYNCHFYAFGIIAFRLMFWTKAKRILPLRHKGKCLPCWIWTRVKVTTHEKSQHMEFYIKDETQCFTTRWNTEMRAENTTRSGVFLTTFKVFHLVMKHCVECLILLSKQNDFRRRN